MSASTARFASCDRHLATAHRSIGLVMEAKAHDRVVIQFTLLIQSQGVDAEVATV